MDTFGRPPRPEKEHLALTTRDRNVGRVSFPFNIMETFQPLSSMVLLMRAFCLLVLIAVARFFYRMHQVRTLVRRFHKQTGVVGFSPRPRVLQGWQPVVIFMADGG